MQLQCSAPVMLLSSLTSFIPYFPLFLSFFLMLDIFFLWEGNVTSPGPRASATFGAPPQSQELRCLPSQLSCQC